MTLVSLNVLMLFSYGFVLNMITKIYEPQHVISNTVVF